MFIRAVLIRILIPAALAALLAMPAAAAETYEVDPVHSSILFRIKHNDVSWFYGRFNDFSGSIVVDEAAPSNSSVQFSVVATSVDTANERRNDHLRSGDFFEVETYPHITFQSTSVKPLSEDSFEVTGTLSMHGVELPLTTLVQLTGRSTNRDGKPLLGFETSFVVDRTDFGVGGAGGLSPEVHVTVSVQAGATDQE